MVDGTLDDQYLTWLYSLVGDHKARKSSRTYWNLLRQLYSTEFVWFVPNDDNRAEDGRELRAEWAAENGIRPDHLWLSLSCSFLELLIGLSRRLDFESGGGVVNWFWHLLNNIDLLGFNDRRKFTEEEVRVRTDRVIWRTYDHNGNGGLFPLHQAEQDQTQVEIWYQLSAYLLQDS